MRVFYRTHYSHKYIFLPSPNLPNTINNPASPDFHTLSLTPHTAPPLTQTPPTPQSAREPAESPQAAAVAADRSDIRQHTSRSLPAAEAPHARKTSQHRTHAATDPFIGMSATKWVQLNCRVSDTTIC